MIEGQLEMKEVARTPLLSSSSFRNPIVLETFFAGEKVSANVNSHIFGPDRFTFGFPL